MIQPEDCTIHVFIREVLSRYKSVTLSVYRSHASELANELDMLVISSINTGHETSHVILVHEVVLPDAHAWRLLVERTHRDDGSENTCTFRNHSLSFAAVLGDELH